MQKIVYRIIQWTWGFPQSLIGLIVYLYNKDCKHIEYRNSLATLWNKKGGISLGMFIFSSKEIMLDHEYGHSIQSLILGPLYLFVVGIPSYIWCNLPYFTKKRREKNIAYSSLYCEKWADKIVNKG